MSAGQNRSLLTRQKDDILMLVDRLGEHNRDGCGDESEFFFLLVSLGDGSVFLWQIIFILTPLRFSSSNSSINISLLIGLCYLVVLGLVTFGMDLGDHTRSPHCGTRL